MLEDFEDNSDPKTWVRHASSTEAPPPVKTSQSFIDIQTGLPYINGKEHKINHVGKVVLNIKNFYGWVVVSCVSDHQWMRHNLRRHNVNIARHDHLPERQL
jgi:hypothetical protein